MSWLLLLLLASDPLKGSPFYQADIGERAVLHFYDPAKDKLHATVTVLRSADVCYEVAAKLDGGWNPKTLSEALEKRGDMIYLPDLTPVKVLCHGQFRVKEKGVEFGYPDMTMVEILQGEHSGKRYWTDYHNVRVRDAKEPKAVALLNPLMMPPRKPETPKPLLLVDTSWERSVPPFGHMQFHGQVRNETEETLRFVRVKVITKDDRGKLISSILVPIGDMKPGDTKTFTTGGLKADPNVASYDFEFEHAAGELLGYSTPPKNRPAAKKPR